MQCGGDLRSFPSVILRDFLADLETVDLQSNLKKMDFKFFNLMSSFFYIKKAFFMNYFEHSSYLLFITINKITILSMFITLTVIEHLQQ